MVKSRPMELTLAYWTAPLGTGEWHRARVQSWVTCSENGWKKWENEWTDLEGRVIIGCPAIQSNSQRDQDKYITVDSDNGESDHTCGWWRESSQFILEERQASATMSGS